MTGNSPQSTPRRYEGSNSLQANSPRRLDTSLNANAILKNHDNYEVTSYNQVQAQRKLDVHDKLNICDKKNSGDTLDNFIAAEDCSIPGLQEHYRSLSKAYPKQYPANNNEEKRFSNFPASIGNQRNEIVVDRQQQYPSERNRLSQNDARGKPPMVPRNSDAGIASDSSNTPRYCRAVVAPPGGHSSLSLAWG